jgi:polyhydroxyalkanoate synthesis regulator phasin
LILNFSETKGSYMTKKKVIAVVVTTLALTAGSIGVAGAASKASQKVSVTKSSTRIAGQVGVGPEQALATILKDLVTKGSLTQAQADAVTAAAAAAKAAHDANRPMGGKGGPLGADRAAIETLVSTTIGVDTATIKSRLQAGESLAQIAGAKKDALIAALVADETKRIDAAVTAGTLTAAQATTLKANLVAHVTEEVNAVGGKGPFGKGPKGGKGGHGGRGGHGHGGPMGGATAPKLPAPTATPGA